MPMCETLNSLLQVSTSSDFVSADVNEFCINQANRLCGGFLMDCEKKPRVDTGDFKQNFTLPI